MNMYRDFRLVLDAQGFHRRAMFTPIMRASKLLLTRNRTAPGLRYFCQNHGSCGSTYIVELMKANQIGPSFHEKNPSLDDFGINHFEGLVSDARTRKILFLTRKDIFFEANNRLFSMSGELKSVFPDARFIHLHRDGREIIRSMRSKPLKITWESNRRRYTSEKLSGSHSLSVLERMCHYWANYNRRISNDLIGEDYLSLKFSDLISGNVKSLESFMNTNFKVKIVPPANANKPVRSEGVYPAFQDWPIEEQETFWRICGDVMADLGYK